MKLSDNILRKPLFVAFGQAMQGGGITSVDLVAVRDAATVTMTASDGSAAPMAGADASNAGVMTAADKAKLDSLPAATALDFETRSDIATTAITAAITHVRTVGYSAAGDGGGALYRRVGAEPAHNLKILSADGAWWELVPDSHGYVNVRQAGAVADNVTDDGQAFVDALNFASWNADLFTHATNGVIVPPGAYYLGTTTLELKATVHLVGQGAGQSGGRPAELRWDANVTGIIVHRSDTIGAATEADPNLRGASATKIEGLSLKGGGGAIAGVTDDLKGHGIWLRARATLIDLVIADFAGNGIHIVATAGGATNVQGNANNWVVERARITGCFQSGIYVDGADVNAGIGIMVDVTGNGRWGIWDSSFLGNTYVACHAATNGLANVAANPAGSSSRVESGGIIYASNAAATEAQLVSTTPGTDENVWIAHGTGSGSSMVPTWLSAQPAGTYFHGGPYRTDNSNAHNVFLGCYIESGQNMAQYVKPTVLVGGFSFGSEGDMTGLYGGKLVGSLDLDNHGPFKPARDLTLSLNPSVEKLMKVKAESDSTAGLNLVAWDESNGHVLIGEHANLASRRPLRVTTDLNTIKHGRASAQPGGELYFYKGFWIGGGSFQAKHFGGFRAKPTSGDWARGDKIWNYNPIVPGDPAGWRLTTGGTVGSTAVMEEFFYLPDLPGDHAGYNIRPKSDGTNRVQWRAATKAGADTIADAASTVAVTFSTAFANANYSVALSVDGDERVWVTAKTAAGFTLNRAGTAGARAVDWTATPHEDL